MASSNDEIQSFQLGFRHPFTMIVSGSTGSGKSEWILRLFKNFQKLIVGNGEENTSPIELIFYCYGELNPNILQMQKMGKIEDGGIRLLTHHGFPSEELLRTHASQTKGHLLVVLDDLMTGIGSNKEFLESLFTRASHNWGISIILVTQHLFTKELRIPRNNSHYIVLLRNPAGALQIRNLAVQLFPSKVPYFLEAYSDSIRKNFGYLLIDIHPATIDSLRLRTNIYPDDGQPITVYLPK